jgi:hypothetical protein
MGKRVNGVIFLNGDFTYEKEFLILPSDNAAFSPGGVILRKRGGNLSESPNLFA